MQTFATKLSNGTWKLYDEGRQAAPAWKEVCGRSAMSGWINSTSMSRFSSFSSKLRLLDQDLYLVRTPGFEKCDASKAVVKCDIR
ncbi:hypothetical protein G3I77_40115 [Streptomyces sp. D2-8]|nr:hypothetical protein [Streptomyces sp. D2-8]